MSLTLEEVLEEIRKAADEIGIPHLELKIRMKLAGLSGQRNDLIRAKETMWASRDPYDIILGESQVGQVFAKIGNWQEALKIAERIKNIAHKGHDEICLTVVEVLVKKGQFEKARQIAEKIISQYTKSRANIVIALATKDPNDFEKARESVLEIENPIFRAELQVIIATKTKELKDIERAWEMAREIENPNDRAEFLIYIAELLKAKQS